MNISRLEYFDKVYIFNGVNTALCTHGLGNIQLIACVRKGQRCNQGPSNIHDGTFVKNIRNVNLKTLTILGKKVNLRCLAGSWTCL